MIAPNTRHTEDLATPRPEVPPTPEDLNRRIAELVLSMHELCFQAFGNSGRQGHEVAQNPEKHRELAMKIIEWDKFYRQCPINHHVEHSLSATAAQRLLHESNLQIEGDTMYASKRSLVKVVLGDGGVRYFLTIARYPDDIAQIPEGTKKLIVQPSVDALSENTRAELSLSFLVPAHLQPLYISIEPQEVMGLRFVRDNAPALSASTQPLQ